MGEGGGGGGGKGRGFPMALIIAMKGHPGTGKSTLAHSLSSLLKIPLIDKDDVRDCTFPLQSSNIVPSKLLNDLSYDVIWQIASTQLRLGLSVVIDSPLSSRTHLDKLVHLASSTGGCLLIVECKPLDEAEWRRRLEKRGGGGGDDDQASWHKPSTWQDLDGLLERYGGSTDYDVGDVPKLVLDTTGDVGVDQLVSEVMEFIASHAGASYCMECHK